MLNDPCLLCFSGASSQDLCLLRIPNPQNPFTSSSLGWCINTTSGTSVVVQWLKFCLSRQGLRVRLVEQLRSHMPQALPPKNETTIKQKQYYCNIFNKDFFFKSKLLTTPLGYSSLSTLTCTCVTHLTKILFMFSFSNLFFTSLMYRAPDDEPKMTDEKQSQKCEISQLCWIMFNSKV